jgi:hypothetical protein
VSGINIPKLLSNPPMLAYLRPAIIERHCLNPLKAHTYSWFPLD